MRSCMILFDAIFLTSTLISATLLPSSSTTHELNIRQLQAQRPHEVLLKRKRSGDIVYDTWRREHELHKRSITQDALDYLDQDWIGFFDQVNDFLPIPAALSGLSSLYNQVSTKSVDDWVNDEPETNIITMTVGFIQLRMEGVNGAIVPWIFVQTFAAKMKVATQNGFAGSYNAFYQHPNAQISVLVTLTTLAMVAAAA